MPGLRINVPLEADELRALLDMATAACRHPREQMRYLLREEAHRQGLLAAARNADSTESEEKDADDNSLE